MKLSENFYLREFTKSQTASRLGISNNPSPKDTENLRLLAENVLQKARDKFGQITVTSGYRSDALNHAIGGSYKSQHSKGEAADIEALGVSNYTLAEWIAQNTEFDQLILEYYTPGEPNSGWVHVSYSEGNNRKEVLTATKYKGDVVYLQGLLG